MGVPSSEAATMLVWPVRQMTRLLGVVRRRAPAGTAAVILAVRWALSMLALIASMVVMAPPGHGIGFGAPGCSGGVERGEQLGDATASRRRRDSCRFRIRTG